MPRVAAELSETTENGLAPMSVFERLGSLPAPRRRTGAGGRSAKRSVPGEGYICKICNEPGHWIEQCPLRKEALAAAPRGLPADYVCKICSVPGHWIDDCPQKAVRAAAKAKSSEMDAELQENTTVMKEGDDTVVRLYDTELVRIGALDITLHTGGYFEEITMRCMNQALADYDFTVKAVGDEWYVSDGKFRLMRMVEGLKIEGGAVLPDMKSPGGKGDIGKGKGKGFGPMKGGGRGAIRYTPY